MHLIEFQREKDKNITCHSYNERIRKNKKDILVMLMKRTISRIVASSVAMMMILGSTAGMCLASRASKDVAGYDTTCYDDADTEEYKPGFEDYTFAPGEEPTDFSDISPVKINSTNFPDANFRAIISSSTYDKDRNGTLSAEEIGTTINIHCESSNIKSIKGVEYFVNLQGLWCRDNQISSMNISALTDLRGLWCSENNFTSIDMSHNPELYWVYCYDCKLTSLDVTKNPKMAFIECNTNPIPSLDLSKCPELEHLMCGSCNLTSLDVSNNPKLGHLDAFRNHLKSLNVSNNPKLKRLDIWDNAGLGSVDVSACSGLQTYNCAHNDVTSLDVSHNPELMKLICSYNDITSLNLSNNPKLVYLDCACNDITSLDLSHNPALHFLQAFTNPFTTLDIGYCQFLIKTYNEGVMRSEYKVCKGHSWTIDFGGDDSTGGDTKYFLCFDDAATLITTPKYVDPLRIPGHIPPEASSTDLITREALVQTLYEMAGSPAVSGTSRFKDVVAGEWYEAAMIWGESKAICVGYPYVSSDTFGIGQWVEREDLMYMLMRYSEAVGYLRAIDFGRADDFMDYFDVDFYCWEAVTWAATWNIMVGKGDPNAPKEQRRIDPHGYATKEEVTTMIERMYEKNNVSKPVKIAPVPSITPPPLVPGPSFEDFIERMYVVALNRASEPEGKAFWMDKILNEGFSGGRVAIGFLVEAPEFLNRGLSDSDFIDVLYKTFFDRDPDADGKAFWLGHLATDMTRDQIVRGFVDSTEWCNLCANYGVKSGATNAKAQRASNNAIMFATRLYTECLGRNPEASGLSFWSLRLTNLESTGAEAARDFFCSKEFKNLNLDDTQYVTRLYKTFMDREPDADGMQFWLGHLSTDMTREQVLKGFAESQEFTNICRSYGIERGSL